MHGRGADQAYRKLVAIDGLATSTIAPCEITPLHAQENEFYVPQNGEQAKLETWCRLIACTSEERKEKLLKYGFQL
jgi:hypothetical protein